MPVIDVRAHCVVEMEGHPTSSVQPQLRASKTRVNSTTRSNIPEGGAVYFPEGGGKFFESKGVTSPLDPQKNLPSTLVTFDSTAFH